MQSEKNRNRRELEDNDHRDEEENLPRSNDSRRMRKNVEEPRKELIEEFRLNPENDFVHSKDKDEGSTKFDNLYASFLPSSDYYERSYIHLDVVTHLLCLSITNHSRKKKKKKKKN